MAATIAQIRVITGAGVTDITDDDITAILGIESEVYRASAAVCRNIAAGYATKVSVTAGPVKVANEQKFAHWSKLADKFDFRAREGGGGLAAPVVTGVSIDDMEDARADDDRPGSKFTMGMLEFSSDDEETVEDWSE
jgi:hypothetical protein